MATIEKIVHRSDGKIGVWTTPKVELEFDNIEHLRAYCNSATVSLDDAAVKAMLLTIAKDAKRPADMATIKKRSFDAKKSAEDAATKDAIVDVVVKL